MFLEGCQSNGQLDTWQLGFRDSPAWRRAGVLKGLTLNGNGRRRAEGRR